MREQIAAIGRNIHYDARVIETDRIDERLTRRKIAVQLEDAVVIAAEIQFARAAQHALAFHAANLGFLDDDIAGQRRTDRRKRIELAGLHVGRTAHDLQDVTTCIDFAK